jgi:hypothetical protein
VNRATDAVLTIEARAGRAWSRVLGITTNEVIVTERLTSGDPNRIASILRLRADKLTSFATMGVK